ncbi:MAG TPA: Rieske 2Fe-2S domain-containing protein [Candidatus Eisenbacteria bacterium]|jgi:nitrite reductase/ring-hydroxylating ferredoxin subunit|nr:Rieske 2Fe-2S domain-containing protein [Candidatus Eisenbacteria bacterium]
MPTFMKVAKAVDVEEGKGLIVWAGNFKVALFRCEGVIYAIRNQCPHMGGDLGEGLLTGDVVKCPWHGWKFNVKTGKSPEAELVAVRTFEVKLEGEDVLVAV